MAEKESRKKAEATPASQQVERLRLIALDELDGALELRFYSFKGMVSEADPEMAKDGFARAYHRILFLLARRDGVSVGELQAALGVSPQALNRPLRELIDRGHVTVSRDPARHGFKALHLTDAGRRLEYRASERAVMRERVRRGRTSCSARMGSRDEVRRRERLISDKRRRPWRCSLVDESPKDRSLFAHLVKDTLLLIARLGAEPTQKIVFLHPSLTDVSRTDKSTQITHALDA